MPAKSAEERAAYAARRRRREHIGARYTEEEAQRIRNAAAGAGMSLGAYILATADGVPRPIVDLGDVAKCSTLVAALLAAPRAVRKVEADLGRLSGRLSHLFTLDYPLAVENREEIHATLKEVRALKEEVREAVAELRAETSEPRAAVARLLDTVAAALDA
jgi:uncharacterized protein (DUF1778 family)